MESEESAMCEILLLKQCLSGIVFSGSLLSTFCETCTPIINSCFVASLALFAKTSESLEVSEASTTIPIVCPRSRETPCAKLIRFTVHLLSLSVHGSIMQSSFSKGGTGTLQ